MMSVLDWVSGVSVVMDSVTRDRGAADFMCVSLCSRLLHVA